MAFAVHGTAELAFTGAAAGLVIAGNPVAGALAGSLVVAALIATLGARQRERDSAIGAILAFGMGIGILLLGYYQGFATAATNILFGNIFGVSGSQLLILAAIGVVVVAVMATWYRPLLFASIDPEAAEARGVPVRRLGLMFLVVLALTVTGAAQVVGTLLVLSLAITPAAAAQRLSARPLAVAALSVIFAVAAADGGLLASFGASNVKASVFITSISFAIYLTARLAGPGSGTAASAPAKNAASNRRTGHTRAVHRSRRAPRCREVTSRPDSWTSTSPRDSAGRASWLTAQGSLACRPGTPGPPAMTRRRPRADISHRLASSAAATRREAAPPGRIAHTEGCKATAWRSHARTLIWRALPQAHVLVAPVRPLPRRFDDCQPCAGARTQPAADLTCTARADHAGRHLGQRLPLLQLGTHCPGTAQ